MNVQTRVEKEVLRDPIDDRGNVVETRPVESADRYIVDCKRAVPQEIVDRVQADPELRIAGVTDTSRFAETEGQVQIAIELA